MPNRNCRVQQRIPFFFASVTGTLYAEILLPPDERNRCGRAESSKNGTRVDASGSPTSPRVKEPDPC